MMIDDAPLDMPAFTPRSHGLSGDRRAGGRGPKLLVGIFVVALAFDVSTRVAVRLAGRSWRRTISALKSPALKPGHRSAG